MDVKMGKADLYNIDTIHYRNIFGHFLFQTPMVFKRLHGVGEEICEKGVWYLIRRVAVADNIQHVNLELLGK